ncbi:unnamed protein product [Miscanthus lutarioriparius]|uniref:Uncharacterized protein n=1 Tax=Miscanthus lutarioriparius TaxID=422564 RepID=A0A811QGZ8_9POAL|nr:unnamed protein product [Miscanthus lutarioriparius]
MRGEEAVIVSIVGLLLFGKVLEPLWGAKELLKFIFIVNLSTSACVFVTTIVLYYITQEESYLYTPVSGFYGVLSGLLVGIKQILADQELNLFVLKISAKWIPSIVAFISVAVRFFIKESMSYLPIILFGIYMSWIYLRYFQRRLEVVLKGDPSDEFSFSSFFPGFLRWLIPKLRAVWNKILEDILDTQFVSDQDIVSWKLEGKGLQKEVDKEALIKGMETMIKIAVQLLSKKNQAAGQSNLLQDATGKDEENKESDR